MNFLPKVVTKKTPQTQVHTLNNPKPNGEHSGYTQKDVEAQQNANAVPRKTLSRICNVYVS